ncbi:unnamed protein product [Gadus morhua 'NCC']
MNSQYGPPEAAAFFRRRENEGTALNGGSCGARRSECTRAATRALLTLYLGASVSSLKSKLKKQSTATGSGVARAFLRSQAALFGSYRDALRYKPAGSGRNGCLTRARPSPPRASVWVALRPDSQWGGCSELPLKSGGGEGPASRPKCQALEGAPTFTLKIRFRHLWLFFKRPAAARSPLLHPSRSTTNTTTPPPPSLPNPPTPTRSTPTTLPPPFPSPPTPTQAPTPSPPSLTPSLSLHHRHQHHPLPNPLTPPPLPPPPLPPSPPSLRSHPGCRLRQHG